MFLYVCSKRLNCSERQFDVKKRWIIQFFQIRILIYSDLKRFKSVFHAFESMILYFRGILNKLKLNLFENHKLSIVVNSFGFDRSDVSETR